MPGQSPSAEAAEFSQYQAGAFNSQHLGADTPTSKALQSGVIESRGWHRFKLMRSRVAPKAVLGLGKPTVKGCDPELGMQGWKEPFGF